MDFLTPAELKNRKKIWWIGLFAYITVFITGIDPELSNFNLGKIRPVTETLARYKMMLSCDALLLVYFIPFALFMYYTCRKMSVSWKMTILAFFSGWFIPGWITVELNHAGVRLIRNLTSAGFAHDWAPAICGPINEETLKLLVVICLLALLGRHLYKHYLITGMAVGMGFQIGEDTGYILHAVKGSYHSFITAISFTINERIAYSIGRHWCFTGIAAVAIYLIFRQKQKKTGILLLLAAYLDHGLGNAPVCQNVLCQALINAFILLLIFYSYKRAYSESRTKEIRLS